jgi:hypothetical protein
MDKIEKNSSDQVFITQSNDARDLLKEMNAQIAPEEEELISIKV